MKTCDLHGLTYDEAKIRLEEFFNITEPPFEVITGNSDRMKRILYTCLKKHKMSAFHKNPSNTGSVVVVEGEL